MKPKYNSNILIYIQGRWLIGLYFLGRWQTHWTGEPRHRTNWWDVLDPREPFWHTFIVSKETTKKHHWHNNDWRQPRRSCFIFKKWRQEVPSTSSGPCRSGLNKICHEKLLDAVFESNGKIDDQDCNKRDKAQHRRISQRLGHIIWTHVVHLVWLFSEKNRSLTLKHKQCVKHISHKHIHSNEKKSPVKLHPSISSLCLLC